MGQKAKVAPLAKNNSSLFATLVLLEIEIEANTAELDKIQHNPEYQTFISIKHLADTTRPNIQEYQTIVEKRLDKLYSSKNALKNSGMIDVIDQENSNRSTSPQEISMHNQDRCCTIS